MDEPHDLPVSRIPMTRAPFIRTAFARDLTAHMCEWRRGYDGSCHPIFPSWTDGIHPNFREEAVAAVADDEVKLHDYAAAVTSSQMFALNLFLPWRAGPRAALDVCVARVLGEPIVVERLAFEWVPPGGLLGEIDGDRPHAHEPATAVDVALWGRDKRGLRIVVLVEVKLSEGGFTTCGGRDSRANRRQDICASAEAFFGDPSLCYLRRPSRKSRDRRYWEIFARSHGSVRAAFPGASEAGPCPFAGQAQQPMRNLALAHALVQGGVVDRSWFVLCAHDENPDVAERWAEWRSILADPASAPVLPASEVIAAGRAAGHARWADWMNQRYRIPPP